MKGVAAVKQAVLITAYKDESQLVRLMRQFCVGRHADRFKLFVHVDKKSDEIDLEHLPEKTGGSATLLSRYSITWGSVKHLLAILELLDLAMQDDDVSYFHIVSGEDIALHSQDWFVQRFSGCDEVYFGCGDLPSCHAELSEDGGVMLSKIEDKHVWYRRYWAPSSWNLKKPIPAFINNVLHKLQKEAGFRRNWIGEVPCDALRFCMVWGSFPRAAGELILDFARRNRRFLRALNTVRVPEEVFFATALYGTKYQIKKGYPTVRYDVWDRTERPGVLEDRDVKDVDWLRKQYAFARKVESGRSDAFIAKVMDRIVEEES